MADLLTLEEVVALLSDPRAKIACPSGRRPTGAFIRAERKAFLDYANYLLHGGHRPAHIGLRQRRYVHLGMRDGFGCRYCQAFCPPWDWTVDHLLPKARGGRSYDLNLAMACSPCNGAKGDRTPAEWRADLERLAATLTVAAVASHART